jgi:hypothetical protein
VQHCSCFQTEFLHETQQALIDSLHIDNLFKRAEKLQEIAYATPGKNRAIGTPGHEATVEYIKSQLDTSYYDVTLQPVELSIGDSATLKVNNATVEVRGSQVPTIHETYTDFVHQAFATTLAPGGNVTGPLVVVPNLGCEEVYNHYSPYFRTR